MDINTEMNSKHTIICCYFKKVCQKSLNPNGITAIGVQGSKLGRILCVGGAYSVSLASQSDTSQ